MHNFLANSGHIQLKNKIYEKKLHLIVPNKGGGALQRIDSKILFRVSLALSFDIEANFLFLLEKYPYVHLSFHFFHGQGVHENN